MSHDHGQPARKPVRRDEALYQRLRRRRLTEQGLCQSCGKRRVTKYRRCQVCRFGRSGNQATAKTLRQIRKALGLGLPRAGKRACGECGKSFWSPDRTSVTRCDRCRSWMRDVEQELACEQARYFVGLEKKNGTKTLYHQLQHRTGKMTSAKQRRLRAESWVAERDGVPYRRWTKAEIRQVFTPAYCAALLAKCAENRRSVRFVPDLQQL